MLFFQYTAKKCYAVLHMCICSLMHPYPRLCTNKWHTSAITFCPLSLPSRKALEFSRMLRDKQSSKYTSKRISWLLVAVLNATLIV